jgi:hypothetical protein
MQEALYASGIAVRRYFVDVHIDTKRRHHVVYDGQGIRRLGSLTDIPAEKGDEVYVDTLFGAIYDEVQELLKRGVRVFVLKRTDILPRLRRANNIEKSHENDAKILSMIDSTYYHEICEDEIKLRELIVEYNKCLKLLKMMQQLNGKSKAFKEAQLIIRREKARLARRINKVAEKAISSYNKVCDALKLSYGSFYGRAALADILLHIDFGRGLRKILSYLGRHQHNRGHYNGRLKKVLESLSISVYKKQKIRAREQVEILKTIRRILAGGPA